jgi:hypothetical protein
MALGLAVVLNRVDYGSVVGHEELPARRVAPSTTFTAVARNTQVLAMIGLLLLASVPFRIAREMKEVDLMRVSYGFHRWERDPAGRRFRWTGRRARLHVPAHAELIELPLRGMTAVTGKGIEVELSVDGRIVQRVWLADDSWRQVAIQMHTGTSTDVRRIDLRPSATFVPRESLPGSTDSRELGVQVGEVEVVSNW